MEICKKDLCTGCTTCVAICPQACISMKEDEIGHLYAQVDETQCIRCGACKNICPSVNAVSSVVPSKAYAAISRDEAEYKTSTSGGAAAVLSKYIVDNGGVVYGCTGADGLDVHHIRVDKTDDLWKLKGSKYVQSRMGDTYAQMKQDLLEDKSVLFIGTPCQVAGAKQLFGKYERFYTVDLICHGVPSRKLLQEHIKSIVKTDVEEIRFRDGCCRVLSVLKDEKIIYQRNHFFDLYYIGFFKKLFSRSACYNCPYANEKRVSDITVGDFWGVKNVSTLPEHKDGLSVILVNNDKGEALLSNCAQALYMEEHPVEEAVAGNAQLRHPSPKHKNAEKFRTLYPRIGFKKAARRCLWKNQIKYAGLALYLKLMKK